MTLTAGGNVYVWLIAVVVSVHTETGWCQPSARARVLERLMADDGLRRGRLAALHRLEQNRGEFIYRKIGTIDGVDVLAFRVDYSGHEPIIVPETVDDELIRQTVDYLPELRVLELPMTKVTAEGLKHLSSLPYLEHLVITSDDVERFPSSIDDAAMIHIARCTHLRKLVLRGLPVTDKGIACIQGLPHLEYLELERLRITTASLQAISSLPRLDTLYFGGNHPFTILEAIEPPPSPSAAAMRGMAALNGRVEFLWLNGPVHPDLLRAIGQIQSLRRLSLKVDLGDDVLVEILEGLQRPLSSLLVPDASITSKSEKALQRNPPGVLNGKVFRNEKTTDS